MNKTVTEFLVQHYSMWSALYGHFSNKRLSSVISIRAGDVQL